VSSHQVSDRVISQTEPRQPGCGQWLVLLSLAAWLALVPLGVSTAILALTASYPVELVQLGLVPLGEPTLPEWATGLLATIVTLGLHLLVFVPVVASSRKRTLQFVHTTAIVSAGIAVAQALNALARLPWPEDPTATAALQLVLVVPFLLFGLGWFELSRGEDSLLGVWRRAGLRLWANSSAWWLALASGALIAWPWFVVGSLGSVGTTLATVLQALPNALNEEILFRGFALLWFWRAARSGRAGVVASLILFVASQGATVLPYGDGEALLRFVAALFLGLLVSELTVRGGGSIWPAVAAHFYYDWFHLAFVDPRSLEEVLHWLARGWAPLAAGGAGLVLWLGRKIAVAVSPPPSGRRALGGILAAGLAMMAWLGVIGLYLTAGVPGFHPDGFLIFMEEQADLGPAAQIADPAERRAWVYKTLVETAERSQAPLRAALEIGGVPYRPHYLVNMIEVRSRPGLRHRFAEEPGVASVLFQPGVRRYAFPFGLPNMDLTGPQGVEWNVRAVGADQAWALGYRGQGVLVGGADTGVVWDHPALKEAYLGWDGTAPDHDYHWYDAWDGRPEPWDDSGHGTHTIGTVVGRDGENQIGLAPDARWIGCRNMRQGLGNPGSYVTCMEFLLAPFPLDGDAFRDGDPARGADVVNNSWGCPAEEGCQPDTLRIAIENLRAAGQMMVVSAGNEGPACASIQSPPALYDDALTVGAIDQGAHVASFSSRGPVEADGSGRAKPELVAPGVDIRSAVPGGYAPLPGTSMAGPHVAGAVALLWSVEPSLVGDLERTEAILTGTAQRRAVENECGPNEAGRTSCGCGGEPGGIPSNDYGWGALDVLAAVQRVLENR
jgi:subtilisin family serine protease/membrane protease YdiL (CAAX protease family)